MTFFERIIEQNDKNKYENEKKKGKERIV